MLTGGTDPLYRHALAVSHQPYIRVEVWVSDGSERLEQDLIFLDGVIEATLSSQVARRASLNVSQDLYPFAPDDLLNPYSRELRIFRGIRFADGNQYLWQIFRGRITDARTSSSGITQIRGTDRAGDVQKAKFEVPRNSDVGVNVLDQFEQLVSEAVPGAQFGTSDTYTEVMPAMSWEHDRGSALDEIATAVGSYWYPLADGRFVMRRVPWTVPNPPILAMADEASGTIIEASAQRSREEVFNSVTVTGERTDSTEPVFFTARDETPDSPTRVTGPFGLQNVQVQLRTVSNQGSAKTAAESYLRRTTAFTETWTFSCIPDAALELGDVLTINALGRQGVVQVVESMSIPLATDDLMRVSCRSQVVGLLDEEAGFDA